MKTIPSKWSRAWRGDYECTCDVCGVRWRRSQLKRKADGLLYCPDDMDGRDAVTLSELNASRSTEGYDDFNERDGALDRDVYTPFGNQIFDDTFSQEFG